MSITRESTLWCDNVVCGNWLQDTDAKMVRNSAKYHGWITALPGGRDYCSEKCKETAEKETR